MRAIVVLIMQIAMEARVVLTLIALVLWYAVVHVWDAIVDVVTGNKPPTRKGE